MKLLNYLASLLLVVSLAVMPVAAYAAPTTPTIPEPPAVQPTAEEQTEEAAEAESAAETETEGSAPAEEPEVIPPVEETVPPNGFITITSSDNYAYPVKDGESDAAVKLRAGITFAYVSYEAGWYGIEVGNKLLYVKKESTVPAETQSFPVQQSGEQQSISISSEQEVPIYQGEQSNAVIGTLFEGEYDVRDENVTGYTISVAGRSGYILKQDTARPFEPSDQYFTVLQDTPLYFRTGGKLIRKGTVLAGKEFKRVSATADYHHIPYGDGIAHIPVQQTIPSDGKSIVESSETLPGVQFTTKNNVWLYSGPDLKSQKIAMINKGETYPLLKREGTWFVIQFGGHKAYVHPSQARTIYKAAVNSAVTYTYDQLGKDIKQLEVMYHGLVSSKIIGKSVDGRNLYAVKVGKGKKEIHINGAHHAREHMTVNLLMEMIDSYSLSYVNATKIKGYNTNSILNQVSIWFVPMVNPDGVTLVQKGHTSAKNPQQVLKINGGSKDFSSWKANIRGVDLNRQYPANWNNVGGPSSPSKKNYKGSKYLSEPEVLSLVRFVREHDFKSATAYHSSGEILYWHYHQTGSRYTRDQLIAKRYSNLTGYSLVKPSKPGQGGGGFKDWFISETKMTGFTPEISPYVGEKPVPNKYFASIWKKNHAAGLLLASDAAKR